MKDLIKQVNNKQTEWVEKWHYAEPDRVYDNFMGLVEQQHLQNFRLWHQEDIARDPDVSDKEIAQVKRNIDKLNQQRNDLIENIDEFLLVDMHRNNIEINEDAPLNSETPGSMIDRCSIMALKVYHMDEEANREGADAEHKQKAANKVLTLKEQRSDLIDCLAQLLEDVREGTRKFKLYRQFKMYNDPSLNPRIYKTTN